MAKQVEFNPFVKYRARLQKIMIGIFGAKTKEEAQVLWDQIVPLKHEVERAIGIELYQGTPEDLIKQMKDKAPDIYKVCKKWGFVKE